MGRESESYPQTIPPGSTISGWQSEESHWNCSMATKVVMMWKSAGRSGKGSMCCSAELIMAKGQTRRAHLPKKRSLLLLLFEVQDLLRGGLVANISTGINLLRGDDLFPTCQVRVVRFYLSCLLLLLSSSSSRCPPPLVVLLLSLSSSSRCPPRPPAQLRLAIHSVRCRTSTTTIHAQCSLPDLNHDHPRPVFPAGPQPRPSTPSVPCRTSTTTIHAQCSLPDLV